MTEYKCKIKKEESDIAPDDSTSALDIQYKPSIADIFEDSDLQNFNDSDLVFKKKGKFKFLFVKSQSFDNDTSLIVIITDITKIKQKQLDEHKERMLFVTQVTHELRTPLNSIIPMSKKLHNYISDPKGQKILTIVISAS